LSQLTHISRRIPTCKKGLALAARLLDALVLQTITVSLSELTGLKNKMSLLERMKGTSMAIKSHIASDLAGQDGLALATSLLETLSLGAIAVSLGELANVASGVPAREQRLTLATSTLDALRLEAITISLSKLANVARAVPARQESLALAASTLDALRLDAIAISLSEFTDITCRVLSREDSLTLATSALDTLSLKAIAVGLGQLANLDQKESN